MGATYYHPQGFLGHPQAAMCTPFPAGASPWIQPYAQTGYGYEGLGDPSTGYGATAGCPPAVPSMGATYYHPQGFLGHPQRPPCAPRFQLVPHLGFNRTLRRATGTRVVQGTRATYLPTPAGWSLDRTGIFPFLTRAVLVALYAPEGY